MKRLGLRVTITCLVLGLTAACMSSASSRLTSEQTVARPIDFDQPTTPQAAEKAAPAGDRTSQPLRAVAARGQRVGAGGGGAAADLGPPPLPGPEHRGQTA